MRASPTKPGRSRSALWPGVCLLLLFGQILLGVRCAVLPALADVAGLLRLVTPRAWSELFSAADSFGLHRMGIGIAALDA